jgi:clan AA aspartic protease (TIGR02281 family)
LRPVEHCLGRGYYDCTSPDGSVAHSIERCPKGERAVFAHDDSPAITARLDGGRTGTSQVVATGKHFRANGNINGVALPMMVDTGATFVVLPSALAKRAGVRLANRRSVSSTTANGTVQGVYVILDEVSFAGQTVRGVPAVVQMTGTPYPGVLLGMSYLDNFELSINRGVLSLSRR